MDYYMEALQIHEKYRGKMQCSGKMEVRTKKDLSVLYTPGVAAVCREICRNPQDAYRYTNKGNTVGVVTDGSAVLGLGNIGGPAAIPVMEGKALLFKTFADIDAIPICLATQDTEEIIAIVKAIAPTLGGINLEDVAAPRCFEIEKRLQEELDIPVFHDDQHGTAIVVAAAIINGIKLVKKNMVDLKIVVSGAGAAGTAIAKMMMSMGAGEVIVCDKMGAIAAGDETLTTEMRELARVTNKRRQSGSLKEMMVNADVFIGVSAPGIVSEEMDNSMNRDAIVFPMANPEPEILPQLAKGAGARIVGTGRSDYPNQINNVLAFPGVFKGALKAGAKRITEEMKMAAARALADGISAEELNEETILPDVLCPGIADRVAEAAARAWNR